MRSSDPGESNGPGFEVVTRAKNSLIFHLFFANAQPAECKFYDRKFILLWERMTKGEKREKE